MTNDDDKTTPFIRDGESPSSNMAPHTSPFRDPAPRPQRPGGLFTTFEEAKKRKVPKWAAPLLIGAAVFHLGLFVAMWAKSIWEIEQLEKPKMAVDLAVAPAPPPPPPPLKGSTKPQNQVITPKKIKVKDIVQPVKIEKQEAPVEDTGSDEGDPDGEVDGEQGGVVGGVSGGVVDAPPPPPPPPPPPAPPQNVAPQMLEGSRIAGNKNIVPDEVTKTAIMRSGKDKIVGSFKLCITNGGQVSQIKKLKSTGFAPYDTKIEREMRGWRYRPYMVNGRAVPVCTAVTFIYQQK